jgi:hypothetical protein
MKFNNDEPIGFNELPEISQEFIKRHFNENDVSYANIDKELLSRSYEVFLSDGSKIEFNKKGELESVNCAKKEIPYGIIPSPITSYVHRNHPQSRIVRIDQNRRDYEIELDNGIEIKFDTEFNVKKYD